MGRLYLFPCSQYLILQRHFIMMISRMFSSFHSLPLISDKGLEAGWTHKLNHHLRGCRNQINSRDHWHTMAKANQTIIVII